MEEIIALVDYKGHFGSKHNAVPYRSGMDKNLLEKYFAQFGFEIIFKNFSDVDFKNENYKGQYILYTSSEDKGYNYKNYIEDIIWGLKEQEAILIPDFKYLRANNNKVLMEILRNNSPLNEIKNIQSFHYGTLEELIHHIKRNTYPCVIKTAKGAKSTGVHLAKNKYELINFVKEISRTPHFFYEIKDYLRQYKHKGYKTESKYQRKFVVQEYIPNLKNDWKILIFGKKYYILKRKNRKNDFRASGSGLFSFTKEIPFRITRISPIRRTNRPGFFHGRKRAQRVRLRGKR